MSFVWERRPSRHRHRRVQHNHGGTGTLTITSPPAVLRDLVIVGSAVRNAQHVSAATGDVRAFDARTGVLVWTFDPLAPARRRAAIDTGKKRHAWEAGGANVWSIMSVDSVHMLIFLPTASASPNFFGGKRPGANEFANSVVALDALTGEIVWARQLIHHDLWDYDIATQPILVDYGPTNRAVPAVVIGTKAGAIFVFERTTGRPLEDIVEMPVPSSDIAGEKSAPTQPFPANETFRLLDSRLTADSAFGLTEPDRQFCRRLLLSLRNEGIFTPPSVRGTLIWPGVWEASIGMASRGIPPTSGSLDTSKG